MFYASSPSRHQACAVARLASRPPSGPSSGWRPRTWPAAGLAVVMLALPATPVAPLCLMPSASAQQSADQEQAGALDQARALFRNQQFAEGEQLLLRFVAAEPRHDDADEARYLIARAQVRQEKFDDAARSFQWIVNSSPATEVAARSLDQMALLLDRRRNTSGAMETRRRLLRDHPESPTAARVWLEIAAEEFKAERYREAAEIYAKFESSLNEAQRNRHTVAAVLAGNLDNPEVVLENLAETLRGGNIDTALALARAVQRRFPRHPAALEATVREGQCLVAQGGREAADQARVLFERVHNQGNTPESVAELARWELIRVNAGPLGDVDTALKWCQQAIQASRPGEFRHQQAMYSHAWLLWAAKRFDEALPAFEAFAAAYPEQGASAPIQGYMQDCRTGEHRSVSQ